MRRLPHGLAIAIAPITCAVLVWFPSFPALGAPAGSPPATVSEVGSFHLASTVAAPRAVRFAGSNGGISVSPSTDGKLDVRAVASAGDASRVRVVTREDASVVVVCVLFADESPDDCQLGGLNRSGSGDRVHHDEPTVDLVARIPAGISLTAVTMNGAIHAHAVGGIVRATTLNGDVDVSDATIGEATTLNGNIDATLTSIPTARLSLSTKNGNVKVRLPSGTNADLSASTMHGRITANVPLTINSTPGGFGPKSGKGKLGSGGVPIGAETMSGNIDFQAGT